MEIARHIQQWQERVDALELRERLLLLIAAVVVLFLAVDALALQPTLKKHRITEQRIADLQNQLIALTSEAEILSDQSGNQRLAARRELRDRLTGELAALDSTIVEQLGALVEPTQAAKLLEHVLDRHPRLKLRAMRASTETLDGLEIEASGTAGLLGRYQLELEVEGSYLDTMKYLQALEGMPWKFFWQEVDFQVDSHPKAMTRLRLYTLGARNG
jgi:MSHA biogenesis protein MshJ